MLETTYRTARRIAVGIIGGTLLLVGIAMLVLPGPAFVVIPMGLAILGIEFAFARRWLREGSQALYGRARQARHSARKEGTSSTSRSGASTIT